MRAHKNGTTVAIIEAIRFEVYDTGIGISKDNQESLFQLFGRVMQKDQTINKEGIGLGLYITKNLVEELRGIICLESIEGIYTKFVITLPVSHAVNFTKKHIEWLKSTGTTIGKTETWDRLCRKMDEMDQEQEGEGVSVRLSELTDLKFAIYESQQEKEQLDPQLKLEE